MRSGLQWKNLVLNMHKNAALPHNNPGRAAIKRHDSVVCQIGDTCSSRWLQPDRQSRPVLPLLE